MHQPKLDASTLDLPFPPHGTPHPVLAAIAGELTFASPEAQVQRTAELLGAGAIVVVLPPLVSSLRGRLAERLDDLIERELGARGALSPCLTEWSLMPDDAEARLADQLFRARTLGATGIAVAMGSLAEIARPALTPEDSAMMRVLARATSSVPLVVMIDDGDVQLAAYAPPLALAQVLAGADARDAVAGVTSPRDHEPHAVEVEEVEEVEALEEVEREPPIVETAVDAPVATIVDHVPLAAPDPRASARDAARKRATVGVPVSGPSDHWRSWAIALGAARGPQPLAAFERLFTESYMPLSSAIASGVDDPRAVRAHDEFREGFERSYTDAFATFGATGRRPRLVMDAFDFASKMARVHHARSTHVLLVDAMRYDLGGLVRDRMAERAPGVASLTSESLLWSALPTTTFRQLETLARGMDALRAPSPDDASEMGGGLRVETVRRLRAGSRELYKLDVIPAMLGAIDEPGARTSRAHVAEALEGIASCVADALIQHLATLPPRTMLLVLGDRGFCVDRKGHVTHGGASPEEVLVPCFGYLVADLH